MRVVLYSRVSTQEQAQSGLSMEAQARKLTAYAALYELEVVAVIEDAGQSAKSLKRPGVQRAMKMMKDNEADGIVIAKLDRLTRSIKDLQTMIDGYFSESAGKALFSVADSIDTTTASGRMVLNIMTVVSQWERETCGERTSVALQAKIARGERVGAPRFGYQVDEETGQLKSDSGKLEAVELIEELKADGLTNRQIACELTARGIRTKRGNVRWHHSSVASILKRGKYDRHRKAVAISD